MSTEVFPLPISGAPREYAVPTAGAVGRRVAFGLDPAGLARDDRIVWSSANLQSYGGTFVSWSSVRTQNLVFDPIAAGSGAVTSGQKAQSTAEVVTVTSSPGQIKLTRIARGKTDLAGTHSIDVAIMPGGAVVNDTILTSLHLWKEDGSALPVSDVHSYCPHCVTRPGSTWFKHRSRWTSSYGWGSRERSGPVPEERGRRSSMRTPCDCHCGILASRRKTVLAESGWPCSSRMWVGSG